MFKKILIANRGEIACRIIKSARKMGIATVAVYSEADKNTLHVSMADEAVCIGPAASAESYLVIDNVIKACQQTGAEAVHPGFGFLSENAKFAKALEQNGLTFIGPGIRAIEIMGDKIESKKLAASSGVNTVPGYTEALEDADQAYTIAEGIGCPVMLKASAGGGGKGMRVAWKLEEVKDNFISAQNEARNAFGDDRVFVEKFIEQPRHIEIQVLADTFGECIALGERECSIQRRHQKVLEEAPSPFIDEKTRQSMGEQAVKLAKSVDYCSAGTVEFIVDKDRNFYFLEMNTRLQVEHPVTEFVTGLDLVEQMIRIAAGSHLPLKQEQVKLKGWSIEARVYAEDPDRNFMPSIGRLSHYQPPQETSSVRVDTGVYEGGEISMYYDPMIAKLVTYGETRDEAIDEMSRALDGYAIRGVSHNIPFLSALVNHPSFRAGDLTTGFIDDHYPGGFDSSQVDERTLHLSLLLAVFAQHREALRMSTISGQLHSSDYIADSQTSTDYIAIVGDNQYALEVEQSALNSDTMTIRYNKTAYTVQSTWTPGQLRMQSVIDGDSILAQIDKTAATSGSSSQGKYLGGWTLSRAGQVLNIRVLSPEVAKLTTFMPAKVEADLSRYLLSPMPGLLMRVSVKEGDEIKAGQELAVVEAMKMENVLTASQDATVKNIPQNEGASLSVDDIIIEFE